ncbi:sensor histidine kinase [Sanguibacter sp. HDW7]|uniref:sensor histidine kinase n=1 Tax=Sanguibacter sp. HDW7 TaxID=2714931 RepID=UPI0014076E87|nr:histidine kinase [Sanguibacter sp. HDW7]QIK84169.1 histidine kinase [Sanguibacter sp. HDW7]
MRLPPALARLAAKPPVPAPPLTAWGRTWRFVIVVSGAFLTFGFSLPESAGTAVEYTTTPRESLDLALGVLSWVLIWFRRRWPLTIAVVLLLVSAFSMTAAVAATLAVVSVCARRRAIEVVPVTVLYFLTSVTSFYAVEGLVELRWWVVLLSQIVSTVLAVGIGLYIGARRELVWTLQSRAEAAEQARATDAERARAQERAAIAHEMHDVLAHRVSLVAMHAGALAYRTDLSPEEVRESAGIVRDNAHRALEELREVLGVLRVGTEASATDAPQPTIERIDDLVADARALGSHVDFGMTPSVTDEAATLAGSTARTAYRVVQEGLTNARKHAPASPVVVRVVGSPDDGLTVMVRTPGTQRAFGRPARADATSVLASSLDSRLPSSGHGLRGLHERVTLLGGTLDAGDDATGGFVVQAWLPWSR